MRNESRIRDAGETNIVGDVAEGSLIPSQGLQRAAMDSRTFGIAGEEETEPTDHTVARPYLLIRGARAEQSEFTSIPQQHTLGFLPFFRQDDRFAGRDDASATLSSSR